ncbi:MAG TPA: response regulator [Planctomycetota bacterium]|nr:response regulator [Planctomycetota bacterium]
MTPAGGAVAGVLRLLMVDDDEEDALVVRRTLEGASPEMQIDHVATADAAIRRLSGDPYDVALVDYRLGPESGVALVRAVRDLGLPTPTILLTGQGDEDVAVEAMKAGAVDYLQKSRLKPESLAASLRYAAELGRTRARAEAARRSLQRSEERLRRAVEEAPYPIMLHADDGAVLLVSRAWRELSGFGADDLRTVEDWLSRVDAADRDASRRAIRRLYALEGRVHEGERTVVTRRGARRTWDFSSASLGALEDGRRLVMTMAVDLTERRELEARFLQAQKMESVGRLAGGVAHDFNNLLTVIMGSGWQLLEALPPETESARSAGDIVKAADRAAALVRQILVFSRRDGDAPKLIDVNALVDEHSKMLVRLLGENVRLKVRLDPTAGSVRADPGRLEQILMNLAVNARDAMPDGGTLEIAVRRREDEVEGTRRAFVAVLVSDTGTGIPSSVLPHIFEPFFTTKPQGKGTGLGLSTVYALATQMGGSIDVRTEPGRGSVFTVLLPEAEGASTRRGAGLIPARPADVGVETVLVVEDEEMILDLARKTLEARGYRVLTASDARGAEEVATRHEGPLDLVLTDVVLPGTGGRKLGERLRALRPGVKVLCMSGYVDDAELDAGVASGEVAFLPKPFTPGMLARKVRAVLDGDERPPAAT